MMAERGFYHPDRGYWQTLTEPSQQQRAVMPEGTIEVPLKPGPDYEWQNGAWIAVEPPPPQIDEVTAASMRLALLEVGRLGEVEAVVSTNEAAQVEWNFRPTYRRGHAHIEALKGPAGFTDEEIDALFVRAAEIEQESGR